MEVVEVVEVVLEVNMESEVENELDVALVPQTEAVTVSPVCKQRRLQRHKTLEKKALEVSRKYEVHFESGKKAIENVEF